MKTLRFHPYRIFRERGKAYVYHTGNSGLFEVDQDCENLLEQAGATPEAAYRAVAARMSRAQFDALLADMRAAGLLLDEVAVNHPAAPAQSAFHSLVLLVVQACNMRCTYCYGEGGEYHDRGEMDEATAKKAIDYLVKQSDRDTLSVVFFGGEPLLRLELIKAVVRHAREIEAASSKRFSFQMTTNGTLLDEAVLAYLHAESISYMLSFDGCREVQDANRFFADHSGSYDLVLGKTQADRANERISCRASVTPCSLDMRDSFRHLSGLHFRRVLFAPAENTLDDAQFEEYGTQFLRLMEAFEQDVHSGRFTEAKRNASVYALVQRLHRAGEGDWACGAGRTMCAVDIHGDIYPCHRFVTDKAYAIGNIDTACGGQQVFLEQLRVSSRTPCRDCWAKNLCRGGCAHSNLCATGTPAQAAPRMCALQDRVFDAAVRLYLRLPQAFKQSCL
ncbi:MAG: SPASM domain-containing protein [Eubacteriales bacterium]|nr:SPASM domain-containing protein [Eubacteriales bacterium]